MPDVSGPMVMPSHPGAPPTPLSMSSAYNMHHSRLTPDVLTHFSGHPLIQRRFLSNFHSPEYRIYEMNKRMKLRPEDGDIIWWDGFVTEFFHENSSLSLSFTLEDGPKRFTIGRPLIPRYFRSIFENDVTDVFYYLNQSKEAYHHNTFFIEAERAEIHTTHVKPVPTYVTTEGKLTLEFSLDEGLRIKSWHFAIRNHSEFLLRSYVSNHLQQTEPPILETVCKNITRQGITPNTLNYLRLCLILEPMQELMTHHRISGKSPRESLKDVLFQKWHKISAPSTKCSPVVLSSPSSAGEVNPPARVTTKRRKRKTSSASSTASTTVTITSSVASNSEPITTTSPSSMSPPAKKRSNSTCNTHFNPSQVNLNF